MFWDIIILIILLILSGFFSGTEIALVSVSKIKARTLLKQKRRGAKSLCKLKANPSRMIITILMGIVIWIFLLVIGGVIGYFIPDFSNQISLINPSTPYGVAISHALGTLEETSVEVISLGGYYLTFVIWLVIPIFLAIELFNRIEN